MPDGGGELRAPDEPLATFVTEAGVRVAFRDHDKGYMLATQDATGVFHNLLLLTDPDLDEMFRAIYSIL